MGVVKKKPFLKVLQRLLFRIVLDLEPSLRTTFSKQNLCIPATIIAMLHYKAGIHMRKLTRAQLETDLQHLNWKPFIDLVHAGIPFKSLSAFERTLHPFPTYFKVKYPVLSVFSGIALNVYELRRSGDTFRLFPISLSREHNNRSFLQVDMLLDQNLREGSDNDKTKHVLLIKNIFLLVNRFTSKRHNASKYGSNFCRACYFCSHNPQEMERHFTICNGVSRNFLGIRRSSNILLHRPFVFNKFYGKEVPNGLQFKPGDGHTQLKHLSFVVLDYECFNRDTSDVCHGSSFESVPSNALYVQVPQSWAYVHKSNYKNHPLPENLKAPRYKCINDNDVVHGEREFFISLLLSLRKDLLLHAQYLNSVVKKDPGPPSLSQRSTQDLLRLSTQKHCLLCSRVFNNEVAIQRKDRSTGQMVTHKYKIRRTFDHIHVTDEPTFPWAGPKLEAVLCQVLLSYSYVCVCVRERERERDKPFF